MSEGREKKIGRAYALAWKHKMLNQKLRMSVYGLHDLTSSPSMVEQIAEVARGSLDCRAVVIRLKDPSRSFLTLNGVRSDSYFGAELIAISASTPENREWARSVALEKLSDPVNSPGPELEFLVGIPIRSRSDDLIGLVAAIDREPREISESQITLLQRHALILADLAKLVGWNEVGRRSSSASGSGSH